MSPFILLGDSVIGISIWSSLFGLLDFAQIWCCVTLSDAVAFESRGGSAAVVFISTFIISLEAF